MRSVHDRSWWMLLAGAVAGATLLGVVAATPAAAAPPPPRPGTTMSAAAQSASGVFLAYTSTFGTVQLRNVAASPQTTTDLGGDLVGGPGLAVAPAGVLGPASMLAVFGRGTDDALWWDHQTATGWSGWQSLGGTLTAQPAAGTDMTNEFGGLNVFVRGSDGFVWYRVFGAGGWSRWLTLVSDANRRGGPLLARTGPGTSASEVAFVQTTQHVMLLGRTGMENGFVDLGGRTTADPGTAHVPGAHPVAVFARGTDGALWVEETSLPVSGGFGWRSLGGQLTSGVTAATVSGGKTYVFVLGTDDGIWMRSGTWPSLGAWLPL